MARYLTVLLFAGCIEYKASEPIDPVDPTGTGTGTTHTGSNPATSGSVPTTVPDGWALQAFDLPEDQSIDVIVFGDTSSSMSEELKTLGDTITKFVDRLASQVDDWQLASIDGDEGCTVSGILTPSTPDYDKKFADAIVTPPKDDCCDEMGFRAAALAAEASGPGGCNEGLIRGGLLHLIFVSDENDESPGFDQNEDYWRDYWDRIVAVHGDPDLITMSAVAGPTPDGCDGADPGFGYDVAVAGTGGEFLSICSDWASNIEVLADAGVYRDSFTLDQVPVPTSIRVWIDGVEAAASGRWHYDSASNAVIFDVDPPGAGSNVQILYQVA